LLLGCSVAGDFILKTVLNYHSENHRALNGKAKGMLPVMSKSNSNAWVNGTIFQDWFILQFVPAVRQYCSRNNLAFKAILLLDNAPGCPKTLQDLYPEIKSCVSACKYHMQNSVCGSDSHSHLQAVLHEENNQPGYRVTN
jgi:hypothetical protein